jgi:hypothetical protein
MPASGDLVVKQLNSVLSRFMSPTAMPSETELERYPAVVVSGWIVSCRNAVARLAPPGSVYLEDVDNAIRFSNKTYVLARLAALVQALRDDYADGLLVELQALLHAEMFDDFLEQATHLLEAGYKDPAAVLTGSVLEQHLRKLCDLRGVSTLRPDRSPKPASLLNDELKAAGVYNKTEHKQVVAWLGRRNEAAHGDYEEYDAPQVALMLEGVRGFVTRHAA